MYLFTLVDNKSSNKLFKPKHGLCYYLEVDGKKILFDLGPDRTFYRNARKANIKIEDIDIVILSHGHRDHTGGLKTFLKHNQKAKIYAKRELFDDHYYKTFFWKKNISASKKIYDQYTSRFQLFTSDYAIEQSLLLCSATYEAKPDSKAFVRYGKEYSLDKFKHELFLVIAQEEGVSIITGCSHAGIENIIQTATDKMFAPIKRIIGGFHLINTPFGGVSKKELMNLAKTFDDNTEQIYTSHCTGYNQYMRLQKLCHNIKLKYLACGDTIHDNNIKL